MERSGASERAARKGQRTEVESHEKQEEPPSSKTKSIKVLVCHMKILKEVRMFEKARRTM